MPRHNRRAQAQEKPPGKRLLALLECRRRRWPTNKQFADEVGCSAGRLSQLMGDKPTSLPHIKLAKRIDEALGGELPWRAWFESSRPRGLA